MFSLFLPMDTGTPVTCLSLVTNAVIKMNVQISETLFPIRWGTCREVELLDHLTVLF